MRLIDYFIDLFIFIDKFCIEIDELYIELEKAEEQKYMEKINAKIINLIHIDNKNVEKYDFKEEKKIVSYEYSHEDINNAYLAICSWVEERMLNTKWGRKYWNDISLYTKFQLFNHNSNLDSINNSSFPNFLANKNLSKNNIKSLAKNDSKDQFFNKLRELQKPFNSINLIKKEELEPKLDILELFYFCLAFGLKETSDTHKRKDKLYKIIMQSKGLLIQNSGEFILFKHSSSVSKEFFKKENNNNNKKTKSKKLIKYLFFIITILISLGMFFFYPAIIKSLINEIL